MNRRSYAIFATITAMLAGLLLSACQPLQPVAPEADSTGLATAAATVQLSNQPGRAIVSARGNHFIVDSVPPIDHLKPVTESSTFTAAGAGDQRSAWTP